MRQILLQNATAILLQNKKVIIKCVVYELRQYIVELEKIQTSHSVVLWYL